MPKLQLIPAKQAAFKSWSFTRWNDHFKCPLYAKLKHIDKLPEPKSDAMARGIAIANASEQYLKRKVTKLDPALKSFAKEYKGLLSQKSLMVEQSWCFDSSWNPVMWNDWDNVWLRSKTDIAWTELQRGRNPAKVLHIRDGKTGKYREQKNEEYELQLELYATSGFARMPDVAAVSVQLWYTDMGLAHPAKPVVFDASEAPALRAKWEKRIAPMFKDRQYSPRPGNHCLYCAYSKAKGGPCKF